MLTLTKDTFEAEVEKHEGLVVIDLFATWCAPCRMLSPILEELEKEYPDVKFCKIGRKLPPEQMSIPRKNAPAGMDSNACGKQVSNFCDSLPMRLSHPECQVSSPLCPWRFSPHCPTRYTVCSAGGRGRARLCL